MTISELIKALRSLKIQTNSFACLGCGHEHNCGIHGCAIIREAAEKLGDFNAVFNEDTVAKGGVKMDTAARLKALRKENGFTRQEFATECNIPYSTLTNYENGTRTPPYTFLLTAAKLFGVTIDYLLCATNDPNPALKLAGQCLKVEPGRLRELAEEKRSKDVKEVE